MSRKNSQSADVNERTREWTPEMEVAHQNEEWKTAADIERDFAPMSPDYVPGVNQEPDVELEPPVVQENPEDDAETVRIWREQMDKQFNHILCLLSRCPEQQYEPGQFGECTFTTEQVLAICYRIDFDETDKQIMHRLGRAVKKGLFDKVKRGVYKASRLLTMPLDNFMKELDERASKRPMKRLS